MNKRYKTRNGFNVTVLTTERKGDYPVVALVHLEDAEDEVDVYTLNGRYCNHPTEHQLDLVEVLPLEPCPFCGNIDIRVDYYGTIEEDKYCNIKCCNCGIQTKDIYGHSTEDIKNKAFSYWNTRK